MANEHESAPDAVVAGHICLDIIPDMTQMKLASAKEFYTPGKLRNTGAATLSTGGPVSNTGLALVKLGIKTALMGKVGQDPFGQMIRLLLAERWGVKEGMTTAEGATTSYTIVVNPSGYDRMFLHCPGANDTFSSADVDYDLVAKARLFHLGYPPLMRRLYENDGAELVEIYKRVKGLGVTTSLDMSLPDPDSDGGKVNWAKVLEKLVPFVDLLLPSAEETTFMLERAKFDAHRAAGGDMIERFTGDALHALSTKLLALGGKIVAIKCAHRGIYLRTAAAGTLNQIGRAKPGETAAISAVSSGATGGLSASEAWAGREMWHPAFEIPCPPNATGSGDSAIAGFLAGYLRGLSPADTLARANGNGAHNVMAPDALSGIRPWGELDAKIKAGWKTQKLEVAGKGWKRGEDGIWLAAGQ